MIQHLNLVFSAGGLSVGEGAFLMACANHTDAKGYVIAHMQQIADEAHMSLRSAQDQKKRLIERNLLRTSERFSPKNGAQIANLFRINVDLLASMKRARTDYGPTFVEDLTFDAPPENPSSDPHADLAPPPAKSAGGGGAESAPLLLPSSSPSSLSPIPDDAEMLAGSSPDGREREAAAPENDAAAPAAVAGTAERVADAWATGLKAGGRPPMPRRAQAVGDEAARLLTAGHSLEHLCRVAEWMGRAKPTWRILEDALTWPEAPQPKAVASSGGRSGMRRQDAIAACGVCDAYGQIERDGRVRMCRHDGEAVQEPAAVPQEPTVPSPVEGNLGDLLRAMHQPAI